MHHLPGPRLGRMRWRPEHPRQPYEFWWSILLGTFRWLAVRFFLSTRAVGMYLDDRTVEADRLDLDADQLLMLQLLEQALQHTGLRPAAHPRVDRVTVAKSPGSSTRFAAVPGHIKHSVGPLQVAEAHIATLNRQELLDTI